MKLWERIRAVVLCGLGGLGMGLLMCRLLGYSPEGCLMATLAGGGSGLLGTLLLGRKRKFAAAVMAIGVLGSALLGLFWFRHFLPTLTLIAASLLAFGAIIAGGCGFCGYLGCWSVVLLTGAALLSGRFGAPWQGAASLCAILALVLTLDGFRDTTLRKGQHLDRDTPLGSYSLRRNSLLLYGLFLVGAVVAAVILMGLWSLLGNAVKALLHLILTGTGKFGYGVTWLILQFMNFIKWLLSLLPKLPEDRGSMHGGSDYEPPVYTGGPGSLLTTVLFVLMVTAGIILLAGAAGTAMLRSRRKPHNVQEADYVDEVESLKRPKRRLFGWWERRKARMSDYQGAMKIRFAFQQLLRRRRETDPMAYTKTPNELRQPGQADQDALIDAYNRVRYGQGSVTEEDIAAAERVLKTK